MSILFEHTLLKDFPALAAVVKPVGTVIDVGAGLRPALWQPAERRVCIEPCPAYADVLAENGFEVVRKTAVEGLSSVKSADLILMLDVIEHMERNQGELAVWLAERRAVNILIYTPNGFVEQKADAWGMGQDTWQTHRSGWTPADFPGWQIFEREEGFAAYR